jgi:hypothetical protein
MGLPLAFKPYFSFCPWIGMGVSAGKVFRGSIQGLRETYAGYSGLRILSFIIAIKSSLI